MAIHKDSSGRIFWGLIIIALRGAVSSSSRWTSWISGTSSPVTGR